WWRPDLFDNEVIGFSKKTLAALEKLPRNASLKDITKEEKAKVIGITGSADTRKLCNLNLLRAKIEDKKKGLLDSLYEIFRITGYISQLMAKPSVENEEKLYNIAQLTGLFDRYERRFSRPSAKSLLWLLYKKTMDKGMDQVITTGENAAKCMTVHKAKGLEFPAVVVCSCIEGDFPLRYRARETICGIPIPPDMLKSKEPDMDEHLEEELRLFYVAITRAQDLLVITVPDKINVRKAKRSSFVKMIEEYVTETVDSDITMEKKYKQPKPVTTLSYSAVHAYKDCPFRYKINYVYGFVSPTEPMQRLGIIIHNVLQKVNWALQNDRNVTGEILKKFMEESWLPIAGKKTEENFRKQVFEHIKDYIAFARKEFKRIQCFEKPFTHIDGSLIMRGKVDLVAEDKSGKNVLVDFKAMKKEGIKKTGVEDQLGIYRHCLMDMKIDRMATYTFYDNQFTDFTYDEKATKRLLSDVTSGLLKESFPMKKDKTDCDACPYQFICAELPNG
ncbi:MAG: ATP-dependent helicase, partial [Spirochaetaceae bacterium]